MNYIGIDIGTTNIKIIETDENLKIINKKIFEKINPNVALEEFINTNNINLNNIKTIAVTGVGQDNFIKENVNEKIVCVSEFNASGICGKAVLKDEDFLIASAGTGTAFILNKNNKIIHKGGTGIGGGTLINLCKIISPNITFDEINKAIEKGHLDNIDLKIKDVTTAKIETLPEDVTAVNFGKCNSKKTKDDVILGIINMIFETIGVLGAIIAKENGVEKIIVTGQIAKIPYATEVFSKIEKLHNVEFIIPENVEYMTALGAAYIIINS